MLQLEIHGRPIPCNSIKKGRHGFYNPKAREMEMARWQIKAQFNQPVIKGAVRTRAIYYFKIPKNTSSVKRRQMLANIIKHGKRPDRGNLDKFLEDVLKGIVIEDDSFIWDSHHTKLWCDSEKDEKTLIYIYQD